jgi:hypothetical protein
LQNLDRIEISDIEILLRAIVIFATAAVAFEVAKKELSGHVIPSFLATTAPSEGSSQGKDAKIRIARALLAAVESNLRQTSSVAAVAGPSRSYSAAAGPSSSTLWSQLSSAAAANSNQANIASLNRTQAEFLKSIQTFLNTSDWNSLKSVEFCEDLEPTRPAVFKLTFETRGDAERFRETVKNYKVTTGLLEWRAARWAADRLGKGQIQGHGANNYAILSCAALVVVVGKQQGVVGKDNIIATLNGDELARLLLSASSTRFSRR